MVSGSGKSQRTTFLEFASARTHVRRGFAAMRRMRAPLQLPDPGCLLSQTKLPRNDKHELGRFDRLGDMDLIAGGDRLQAVLSAGISC